MRKIISSVYMSLDGIVTNPQEWTFEFRDDKADQFAHDQLFGSDALLMGRATYEVFSHVWPTVTDETGLAERMNTMPKYVASTTLEKPEWNATVLRGDVPAEIVTLRSGDGGDLLQYGYGALTQTLLEHDLLDELRVWLHPVLVGRGGPDDLLLRTGTAHIFELLDHQRFDSGLIILRYHPSAKRGS